MTAPTSVTSSLMKGKRKKDKKEAKEIKKEKKKRARELDQRNGSSDASTTLTRNDQLADKIEKKLKKVKPDTTDSVDADVSEDHKRSQEGVEKNQMDTTTSVDVKECPRPLVESSALPAGVSPDPSLHPVSLLLFYQYIEPPWEDVVYQQVLHQVEQIGKQAGVTGRMRVAKEGLNCTLSGTTADSIRSFCYELRRWKPDCFLSTEFKITHHLPNKQAFTGLKVIPVVELVHYGLEGSKAPPIQKYSGIHLDPKEYHQKLAEKDTVVIDVRNHYESIIGRFDPPGKDKFLDPKMRKSTEFPVWLDSKDTREKLRGKNVMMYCTGGIRCERASALLKYKMETDDSIKELGIRNVYQLQGGVDKYFKEFPDGGYWKGKNYTFDKRFAHVPADKAVLDNASTSIQPTEEIEVNDLHQNPVVVTPMAKCEACRKSWDKYRGKRRCPTCGVPSLICRDCFQSHKNGTKILDRSIRCDLCVEQEVLSKNALREKEQRELQEYERRQAAKGLLCPQQHHLHPNSEGVTRLYLKNMCRTGMTEKILLDHVPGITHIVWRTDRTGKFYGQGWVEMESPAMAAAAVSRSGSIYVLGRPLYIEYQSPDGKDLWPPPRSAVS